MEKEKKLYIYDGPVMMFDNIVERNWYAETIAISNKKALSNLAYRFKREFGYAPGAAIRLIKDYLSEEGGQDGRVS